MSQLALPHGIPTESNPEASSNFKDYVDGRPTPGVDGYGKSKDYITSDDLEKYWSIEKIDQLFLSFNPAIVLSTTDVFEHYLRTLSILAYIGKAGYIHWFFTHDHDDTRLPHESMPHGLPGGDDLYRAFSSNQWRFCPYEFNKPPYMKPLDANCILPIEILDCLSPLQGKCEHIVECLGSFKQIQSNKYTIILEYADGGTLLELFKEDKAPLKHQDRVQFWGKLFDLLIGLQRIHGLQSDGLKGLMSLSWCVPRLPGPDAASHTTVANWLQPPP